MCAAHRKYILLLLPAHTCQVVGGFTELDMCEPVFNMSVCCKVFATHSLCIIGSCASLGGLFKVVCSACFHAAGV